MKSISLSIVFSFFYCLSFSQNIGQTNLQGDYFVISTSGLNLRSAPNIHSDILTTIPFGTKVKVISKESLGIDTLGSYQFKYMDSQEFYTSDIIGNWLEVKHNNQLGYLFDAYLYRYFEDWATIQYANEPNLNEEYVLLFPGNWCNYNFWFDPSFEWIGCYQVGEKFELKKLKLSFYKDWNGDWIDIGISTDDNIDLLFIIGSKSKFALGEVKGKYNMNWWTRDFEEYEHLEIRAGQNCKKLILTNTDKEQLLNAHHQDYYSPSGILWEGDLDNDGQLDYIIHYGEKSGKTYLYLSSEAERNQIVKPVALFFSGYCC